MTPNPDPAAARSPSRDDSVTIRTCPACGQTFTPSGRRRWCSDACKQAAWRRGRTPATPVPPLPPLPPLGRKRDFTVYECGQCGLRALGIFSRLGGAGGTVQLPKPMASRCVPDAAGPGLT